MNALGRTRERRWLTTALAGVAAVVVLFFVPVSYDVVVGHEVSLDLQGTTLDQKEVQSLAGELGEVLNSADVAIRRVAAKSPAAGSYYTLTTRVTNRSRGQVEQMAAGFSASLAARGVETSTSVRQLVEQVTGNVCTAAASSVAEIWIDFEGMSAEDVAAEIRSQLQEAGIDDAEVSVDLEGNCCQISIQTASGQDMALPDIRCQTPEGGECRAVGIEVRRTPEMSDEDVIADVERQLAEHGISATVSIEPNGNVRIEMDEDCQ